MKIKAICPHCNKQVSRAFIIKVIPHKDLSCPYCNMKFRTETKSEWIGSAIIALPIVSLFILEAEGYISWAVALTGVFGLCVVGVVAFPYITKFISTESNN